jgi:signal transduction histidine kinase/ABC-type amino acid transport substrate-binding protein
MKTGLTIFVISSLFLLSLLTFTAQPGYCTPESTAQPTPRKLIAAIPHDFPPTYYRDKVTGKAAGFAVDVMNEVARRAGFEVEYIFGQSWDLLEDYVISGKADLVPNLTIDEKRMQELIFTQPVETLKIALIARASDTAHNKIEPGMKIGVMKGSSVHNLLSKRTDITVIPYPGLQELMMELLAGRLDLGMTAASNVLKMARDSNIEERFRIIEPAMYEAKRAMALRPGNEDLRDQLNTVIDKFVTELEYQKIYQNWWGKPVPYWTTKRVGWSISTFAALLIAIFVFWRFREKDLANQRLEQSATELRQMSHDLTKSYDALHEQTDQLETEMAGRQMLYEALQKKTDELEVEIEERQTTQQNLEEQTVILEEEVAVRARIQEEHDRLTEQLLHSQKMEAIGLLAGGVAHDFNNILSVIMGYGDLLTRRLSEEKVHEHATQILKAAERAAELTRGLLAFGRKQNFNLERTDINQLATDNCKFLKRLIGEDIELVTAFHPIPLFLMLDAAQIQQVFMNLATNARDAMPAGGKMTISITAEKLDDRFIISHGFGAPGAYAIIQVSDTGAGMDRETVERIFEPFFTTKKKGKGTGLGLSIIHGIIAQHYGFILCSSEPEKGTIFSIYIPLSKESEQTVTAIAEIDRHSLRGTETILLAEDDQMLMEINTEHLASNGYRVLQAFNGAEAVDIFIRHQDEIDLVMLDAIMPKMTGKQAWDRISELRPNIKTCFFSGYTTEIISGKLAIDFSVPFISKPVKSAVLLQKVREILDGE